MKRIIAVSVSLLLVPFGQVLSAPYYYGNPFYIGAEVGSDNLHYEHQGLREGAKSVKDKAFAGRLLAGFNVNQNVGLELGYTRYQDTEYYFDSDLKAQNSQQSLDFLTKLSLPVSCNVSVYTKAGMSYVHRSDAQIVRDNVIVIVNNADDHLRPMLGVGLAYNFNARVAGNIGYYRTFGTDTLPDADFYGAGMTFRLG